MDTIFFFIILLKLGCKLPIQIKIQYQMSIDQNVSAFSLENYVWVLIQLFSNWTDPKNHTPLVKCVVQKLFEIRKIFTEFSL